MTTGVEARNQIEKLAALVITYCERTISEPPADPVANEQRKIQTLRTLIETTVFLRRRAELRTRAKGVSRKLSPEVTEAIRQELAAGVAQSDIAQRYNTIQHSVSIIHHGGRRR